jgi:hypothetical protein
MRIPSFKIGESVLLLNMSLGNPLLGVVKYRFDKNMYNVLCDQNSFTVHAMNIRKLRRLEKLYRGYDDDEAG